MPVLGESLGGNRLQGLAQVERYVIQGIN